MKLMSPDLYDVWLMMTSVSAICCCVTTMRRLSGLKEPPFIDAHKFSGQRGGSAADLGRSQLTLAGLDLTSMSTGRVARGWHARDDLTHTPGSWLAGSWADACNWAMCFSFSSKPGPAHMAGFQESKRKCWCLALDVTHHDFYCILLAKANHKFSSYSAAWQLWLTSLIPNVVVSIGN